MLRKVQPPVEKGKGERRAVARGKSAPQASSHAKGGIFEAGKAAEAESRKQKSEAPVQPDHLVRDDDQNVIARNPPLRITCNLPPVV